MKIISVPKEDKMRNPWEMNKWKCMKRDRHRLTLEPAQPPLQYVHSIGIKLCVNRWPPLKAELNTWRHISTSSCIFIMRCLIKHKNNVTILSICCKIWYCLKIKGSRRKTVLVTQQCNMTYVLVFGSGTNLNVRELDIVMKG